MRSIDFTWAFVLQPVSAVSTRFVIRARARYAPRWSWLVLGPAYGLGDVLNAGNILRAVKKRSESPAGTRTDSPRNRDETTMQPRHT
jgi:hypothetical protein